jgi:MoaA/NifB/PqqE/SkfB family radical SAM enzyme
MNRKDVIRAWGRILSGRSPLLSIEITRECPLRCPGCYAYDEQHLGGLTTLRDLSDYRGDKLVDGVLRLVDRERPLHLSIVGGDPLVRYRELMLLLPQLEQRGIYVQVVTSAFRPIPQEWDKLVRVKVVVSIDGLQPEHDQRRKPATYDRILQNIAGRHVTVHCTITGQMMTRAGYLEEFLEFWTARPEIEAVWMSMFTPQRGASAPEILTPDQRQAAIAELLRLRRQYPKLDMFEETIAEFAHPPQSPEECIFAQTTATISADLTTRITPCQFGGDPDCSQCGCIASMALAGVGRKKSPMVNVRLGTVLAASAAVGHRVAAVRRWKQAAAAGHGE